ncbi:hypothetical protein STEG23_000551, partial [Scotinomys teguina]
MYRLNVDGVEIYVIVTRNVFSHRLSVYRKYDLKGSTVAREASDKEKAKELPTLKDNDFINEGQKIYIDDNNKKIFLEKLKKDVEFLAQLKLMDYSLLVGIHDVERAEQEEVEDEENDGEEEVESDGTHPVGTPPDSPGNTLNSSPPLAPGEFDPNIDVYAIKCHENSPRKEVYFMAIIDILTHYDAKKKAAHAAKTVKHGGTMGGVTTGLVMLGFIRKQAEQGMESKPALNKERIVQDGKFSSVDSTVDQAYVRLCSELATH